MSAASAQERPDASVTKNASATFARGGTSTSAQPKSRTSSLWSDAWCSGDWLLHLKTDRADGLTADAAAVANSGIAFEPRRLSGMLGDRSAKRG